MSDEFRQGSRDEETFKFDRLIHAVTIVGSGQRLGHDGFVHHTSGKQTGIANGASVDFLMVTGAAAPHIQRVELNLEAGDIDLVMYEGVTTSDDGGALTQYTTNRNSEHQPDAVTYGGPTITDLGTPFHTLWVPPTSSGVGNSVGVLDVNQGEEWILKPNTKYAFRITNNSGGIITLAYEFVWYEVHYTQ